jgi:hypothetical protein
MVMKSLRTDLPNLGLGETLSYLEIDLNQNFPREFFRYWQGRLLAIRFESHEAPRTPTYPPQRGLITGLLAAGFGVAGNNSAHN